MTDIQLRRDARRNRGAILDAARELFAESADFSMCEVPRRAGVGQATLYRNFPERRALAAEVLGEQLERITQLAAECAGDSGAFFILLRSLTEGMADLYALGELARADACVGSQLEGHRQRIAELMKRPLSDAKAAASLRRDTSLDDVFLIPVRLDDCQVPVRIQQETQYVDLFPDWAAGLENVFRIIEKQMLFTSR